jgi:predicted amidohydrolase
VYIVVPFLEVVHKEENLYFNACVLCSPEGLIVAHYRKNGIWCGPESTWATAGDQVATYQTEYGKVGLAICYDIHSMLGRYGRENIWTLLYPIGWVGDPDLWFKRELPRRFEIIQLPYYVCGANWSVKEQQNWEGYGCSTTYAPGGKIINGTSAKLGNTIIYADIETEMNPLRPKLDMKYDLYDQWDTLSNKYQ